jgi:hypothetical protein
VGEDGVQVVDGVVFSCIERQRRLHAYSCSLWRRTRFQ